jgi:hypothetical protein
MFGLSTAFFNYEQPSLLANADPAGNFTSVRMIFIKLRSIQRICVQTLEISVPRIYGPCIRARVSYMRRCVFILRRAVFLDG